MFILWLRQVFWLVSDPPPSHLPVSAGSGLWMVYVAETHSSGTAQDLHLIPFWPPRRGTETACKVTKIS